MVSDALLDTWLVDAADDVRDMGQRVLNNGPERFYAKSKLSFALTRAAEALTYLGWEEDDLVEVILSSRARAADVMRWYGSR